MPKNLIVIDGPAGAGKSTVAKLVAAELGFNYVDTGAIYRTFGLWCVDQAVPVKDLTVTQLDALFETFSADFVHAFDPEQQTFTVAETDYTKRIRSTEGSQAASAVAQISEVRTRMVALFRELMRGEGTGTVAEGRDLTTVVAPDATLRLLVTAREDVRMARRGGDGVDAEKLVAEIRKRDQSDAKMVDFMKPADGVHLVDTSDLTIDQVVAHILDLFRTVQQAS